MSNFDFGKKLSEKKMKSRTTPEGTFYRENFSVFFTLCSAASLNRKIYIISNILKENFIQNKLKTTSLYLK